MKDDKYGNIDTLMGDKEAPSSAPARRKRPAPAINALQGRAQPTRAIDNLKELNADLLRQLEEAKNTGSPIILTMPVTKTEVAFDLKSVDPQLIDVSDENERIQDFLDEGSLQDILPSIKKHKQQKPGTIRPKANGRFELIEGSRRLASVKLAGQDYLALVGDVPDADVYELSVIENKHKDVSPYEKAKAYQRQIENGLYENWTQLGAAKGISSSHVSRFKQCAELDEIYVRILPSPSDMPLSYGETILSLAKKGEQGLNSEAETLLGLRRDALESEQEVLDFDEILKRLKSAVRSKVDKPAPKKPLVYKSKDKALILKHSISSNGNTKFEVSGADDTQLERLTKLIAETLKVSLSKG